MEAIAIARVERTLTHADPVGLSRLRLERAAIVLAVCDLSSAAINAAWRAAMVARELKARLLVMYPQAAPKLSSTAGCTAQELRDEIQQRIQIVIDLQPVSGSVLVSAVAAARSSAVVVIPSQRGNPLREWIMGTQAERLIRLCRAPVLVVKRPARSAYARVLVAAQLEPAAADLMSMAASLSLRARLDVLHVLGTADESALQDVDPCAAVLQAGRQYRAQGAYVRLHQILAEAGDSAADAFTKVEFGDAADMVLRQAHTSQCELIVMGKRRRGLLAEYFLGGATQRVLARAHPDVLVLPLARSRAGQPARQDALTAGSRDAEKVDAGRRIVPTPMADAASWSPAGAR
jgi:nucleotide-binding universal stress UspA family protein